MLRRTFVTSGIALFGERVWPGQQVYVCCAKNAGFPEAIVRVAQSVAWKRTPAELLNNPVVFLAHVMTFGDIEDVVAARKYFSEREWRQTLEEAPSGIFDPWSWNYWNLKFGRNPAPHMPRGRFGFTRRRTVGKAPFQAQQISKISQLRFPSP